jgi:Leucine-rich repeat (LRR) protein
MVRRLEPEWCLYRRCWNKWQCDDLERCGIGANVINALHPEVWLSIVAKAALLSVDTIPENAMRLETRILPFPPDRNMGRVLIRPQETGPTVWSHPDVWDFLAVARGEIVVPAGHEAELVLNEIGGRDLSPLAHFPPAAFQYMHLYFARQVLDDAQFQHLRHLTGLYGLDVGYDRLTSTGLSVLQHLHGLRDLRLGSVHAPSQVRGADLALLQELPHLQVLRLTDIPLDGSGLGDLPHLQELSIAHLRRVPRAMGLAEVGRLRHTLRSLRLELPWLGNDDLANLRMLEWLETLNIAEGVINGEGLVHLAPLPRLRHLRLSQRRLRDTDAAILMTFTGLETLHVSDTVITDAGLIHISAMPQLRRLTIGSIAPFTQHGIAALCGAPVLEDLSLDSDAAAADCLKGLTQNTTIRRLSPGVPITNQNVPFLTRLERLEELDLSEAQIDDTGTAALAQLPHLRVLDLSYTSAIGDRTLAHVGTLPHLEILRLEDVKITSVGLAHLAALHQLKILVCECVPGTRMDMALFQHMPQLEVLSLYDGTPDGDLALLQHLPRLEFLLLSHLRSGDLISLRGLPRLVELRLGQCHLDADDIATLRHLPNLQSLVLGGSVLTDAGWAALGKLTQVRDLYLGASNIQDRHLEHLAGLSHLRKLDLEGTQISAAGLPALGKLTRLETLCLRDTHIGGTVVGADPLTALVPLQALINLDLMGTHVERERERDLQRLLPNLR